MHEIDQRHGLVIAQLRVPAARELVARHLDFASEIGLLIQEYHRGHQLGQTGDRRRGFGVLLEQHLVGDRVQHDGIAGVDDATRRAAVVPAGMRDETAVVSPVGRSSGIGHRGRSVRASSRRFIACSPTLR